MGAPGRYPQTGAEKGQNNRPCLDPFRPHFWAPFGGPKVMLGRSLETPLLGGTQKGGMLASLYHMLKCLNDVIPERHLKVSLMSHKREPINENGGTPARGLGGALGPLGTPKGVFSTGKWGMGHPGAPLPTPSWAPLWGAPRRPLRGLGLGSIGVPIYGYPIPTRSVGEGCLQGTPFDPPFGGSKGGPKGGLFQAPFGAPFWTPKRGGQKHVVQVPLLGVPLK